MLTRRILDYASRHPIFRVEDISRVLRIDRIRASKILYYLEKKGDIRRIMKGVYTVASDDKVVATGIYRPSYISMFTALYLHGVLLQVPRRIQVVTTKIYGVKKVIFDGTEIVYYKISPRYFFGYIWRMNRHTYFLARPEKAIIDIIYYGMSPNIGQIDLEQIDLKRLRQMARIYPKTLQAKVRNLIRNLRKLRPP